MLCLACLSSEVCLCHLKISSTGHDRLHTAGLSQVLNLAGTKEEAPLAEKMEVEQPRKRKERCASTALLLRKQASSAAKYSFPGYDFPQGGAYYEVQAGHGATGRDCMQVCAEEV